MECLDCLDRERSTRAECSWFRKILNCEATLNKRTGLRIQMGSVETRAISPMDEFELIESFKNGDEFAFVGLYNRFKGPVFAFCFKMLMSREQAQDVMQETFLRVYENRDRLLKTASFRSWLFTIARNQCLNQIRMGGRQINVGQDVLERTAATETPFTRMDKSQQVEFVSALLGMLKPEYREVLVLREYQNLSYEEIAAVTRNSLSSVKSRLFKARKKLADVMQENLRDELLVLAKTEGQA